MNLDNMNKLIERLKGCEHWSVMSRSREMPKSTKGFNAMWTRYEFPCGSPANVAGHCADLMGVRPEEPIGRTIMHFLECDARTADLIACCGYSFEQPARVTVEETVAYLEELRDQA